MTAKDGWIALHLAEQAPFTLPRPTTSNSPRPTYGCWRSSARRPP
ncbi:hypothetical protein, partial [Nocardia farcinica]